MTGMVFRPFSRRIMPLVAVFLLIPTLAMASQHWDRRGRKYKAPPPTGNITVIVRSERYDSPIQDAGVVFTSIVHNKPTGYMELHTSPEGKVMISVIPIGNTFQLQVLKDGYDTFGQLYQASGPKQTIIVRLLPPQPQYSVYKKQPKGPVGTGGAGTTEPKQQ